MAASGAARKTVWITLLGLAAATLIVYATSIGNGFVLDDDVIIVKNPMTVNIGNVNDLLFAPDAVKPYYRPLNRATYLLDYRVFGMVPAGFHAVNIAIHLMNVLLVYLVGFRILRDGAAAAVAALLFAVHPVNSEAVNFISARNTLLSLSFSLASFLFFLKAKGEGRRWPVLSALLFFFGLLSKETAFMLVVVIALYAVIPLPSSIEGIRREKLREKLLVPLPYLMFLVLYLGMRTYAFHEIVGTDASLGGLAKRLAQNYYVLPRYIGMVAFPADLTIFHSVPKEGMFAIPWLIPAWIAILVIICLLARWGNGAACFGLIWFAVNYIPISNVIPIPSDPMTERFLYMPAVGLLITTGAFFSWIHSRVREKRPLYAAAFIVIVACAGLTMRRNLDWKDDFTLFQSAARNDPASSEAHYNLGTALRDRGDLTAARREWEIALKTDPGNADALTQMGTLEAVRGDLIKAEQYYLAALQSPPGKVDPGRAMAHYNLGKIYEKQQKYDQALRQYERFLKQVPKDYSEYKPDAEKRSERLRAMLLSTSK